jgi:hypothetical protein
LPDTTSGGKPGRNGLYRTVEELASAKRLPSTFLLEQLELRDRSGGGIVIPYFGEDGSEILERYRNCSAKGPRFSQPKGVPLQPYGLNRLEQARKHGLVILVEGETDCAVLWYHDLPALGIPGSGCAGVLKPEHVQDLSQVFIVNEKDAGGPGFVKGCLEALQGFGFTGWILEVRMPDPYKDPADLHAADPERFVELLDPVLKGAKVLCRAKGDACEPLPEDSVSVSAPREKTETESKPSPTFTATQLLAEVFPELVEVVPGILYEGLNLFAGRPKTGKSWWLLLASIAVGAGGTALGKIEVEAGDVLYLCLEDGKRRLQKRLKAIIDAQQLKISDRLHFHTEWPRCSAGGLDAIEEWLQGHPEARLVVIDTITKFRDPRTRNGDLYMQDYEAMDVLHDLALKRHVAILANWHTRKPLGAGGGDFVDEISSTSGLTGAADAMLVLKHPRHSPDGTLEITGRDVEEQELALQWDRARLHWQLVGPATHGPAAPSQVQAVEFLAKGPATIAQIAQALGKQGEKGENAVRQLLHRMRDNGKVAKVKGTQCYALVEATPNTQP